MAQQYLTLPNGSSVPVREDQDPQVVWEWAKRTYPDAFAGYEEEAPEVPAGPRAGIGAALQGGLERFGSTLRTAAESVVDPEGAALRGVQRGEDISRRVAPGADWSKVKQAYDERGLLPAAGEAISQIPAAVAEQAPNIAASLAAAKAGAMAGTAVAPGPGTVVGGVLGAATPALAQLYGANVERQASEQREAGSPVDVNRGAAFAAAVPGAAAEVAATFIPLGKTLVGKLLGPNAAKALATEGGRKLVNESLRKTLLKGAAVGTVAQIPAEVFQAMLERAQAGLDLTSEDAFAEYGENAYGAALVGTGVGPLARVGQRSVQRDEQAKEDRAKKAAETLRARQEEERRQNSPEYLLDLAARRDAALQELQGMAKLPKPGKDATPQEVEAYEAARERRVELSRAYQPLNNEFKQRLPQIQAAREAQRRGAMTPEDAMLETVMQGEGIQPSRRPRGERGALTSGPITPDATPLESYLERQMEALRYYEPQPSIKDTIDFLKKDPDMARQIAQEKPRIPGLKPRESAAVTSALSLQVQDGDKRAAKERQTRAAQLAPMAEMEEQAALEASRAEQARMDAQAQAEQAAGAAQVPTQQLVAQEANALRRMAERPSPVVPPAGLFAPDGKAVTPAGQGSSAMGRTQQELRLQPLISEVNRTRALLEALGPLDTVQNDAEKQAWRRAEGEAKAARKRLDAARAQMGLTGDPMTQGSEPIYTAEEPQAPEPTQPARRIPAEQWSLGRAVREADKVNPQRDETVSPRDAAQERINRLLNSPDLSDEAYQFLRGLEDVLPQSEAQIAETRQGAGRADTAGDSFYSALDEQLGAIERGEQGVTSEGPPRLDYVPLQAPIQQQARADTAAPTEGRAMDVQAVRAGRPIPPPAKSGVVQPEDDTRQRLLRGVEQPRVQKTVPANTARTLRGPSTRAKPLQTPRLLQQRLAELREAAQQDDGRQGELFLNKEKGAVKPDAAAFKRFTDSPGVRSLKKQLREARERAQRARAMLAKAKELPAIRKRVEAMRTKLADMQKRQAEYKGLQDVLQQNRELITMERNVSEMGEALTRNTIDQMSLRGQLDALQKEQAVVERARETARGTPVFKDLSGQLAEVTERLQAAQAEQASLELAVGTLKAHLKVARALNDLARAQERAPFGFELREVQEQLRVAQTELDNLEVGVSQAQQQAGAEAGARARAEVAAQQKRREDVSADAQKAEQRRLEAMHKSTLDSRRYDALDEAQRAARANEDKAYVPELTAEEKNLLDKDPEQVLGGYRAQVAELERKVAAAQRAAKASADAQLEPLRRTYDRARAAYLAATTSKARDNLGPRLDAAGATLRQAEERFRSQNNVWRGMKRDVDRLAEAYRKEAWLEDLIASGRLDKPTVRATVPERPMNPFERVAAMYRGGADAPATSGEALTRSEAIRAREPKKTLFKSRGGDAAPPVPKGTEMDALLQENEKALLKTLSKAVSKRRLDQTPSREIASLGRKLLQLANEGTNEDARKQAKKLHTRLFGDQKPRAAEQAQKTASMFQDLLDKDPDASLREKSDYYEQRAITDLNEDAVDAAQDGRTLEVLERLEKDGSSPFAREVAGKLRPLLARTKLRVQPEVLHNGQSVEGKFDPETNTVYVAEPVLSEEVLLHELTHAATERALTADPADLTSEQRQAATELKDLLEQIKRDPAFEREYGAKNVKELVSELMSNEGFRTKLDTMSPQGNWLQRVYDALLKLLGLRPTTSEAAARNAFKLFQPSRPMAGRHAAVPSLLRGVFPARAREASASVDKDVVDLVNRTVGRASADIGDKITAFSTGLAWRTALADRWAPAEALVKWGVDKGKLDEVKALQTRVHMRLHEDANRYVATAAADGVPRLVLQDDGVRMLEGQPGANLFNISETLQDAQVGNEAFTEALFTNWLAVLRAEQDGVGYDKLNLENPLTKEEAQRIKAAVESNPQTKAAFETARKEYRTYNQNLMALMVDAGVLSKQKAAELAAGDYVPYYRDNKGVIELVVGNSKPFRIGNVLDNPDLKELLGGNEKILPFFAGAIQNTSMLMRTATKNLQAKDMAYVLQDLGLTKVRQGAAPDGIDVIKFDRDGLPHWAKLDKDVFPSHIPAELLVQGMAGVKTAMPALVKAMAIPANILRKAVTRMPLYAMRQMIRDPMHAWLTTGGNFTPVVSSIQELVKVTQGRSTAAEKLMRAGAISSNVQTGDMQDVVRILRDVSSSDNLWNRTMAKLDAFALQGDASTRAVLYDTYRAKGLTHTQAVLGAAEVMNFARKGTSSSARWMSTMIPFFNAQIQGIDAVYRAFKGDTVFQDQMDVRNSLLKRGMLMLASTLAYTALMQDDEAYKNAGAEEKALNWFVRVPGVSEAIRVPIPFELGLIFKSLPEAVFNTMFGDTTAKEAAQAMGKQIWMSTPFAIPTAAKPALEMAANYSFFTDAPIESVREQGLAPSERYREGTTELAKLLGRHGPLSPVQVEHLVRGYLSSAGILMMSLANPVLRPFVSEEGAERPALRLSQMPLFGPGFQPDSGRGLVNAVYEDVERFQQAHNTYRTMLERGERAKAAQFAQDFAQDIAMHTTGGKFRQQMGELAKYRRAISARKDLTPEQKRQEIDRVQKLEIQLAKRLRELSQTS